MRSFILLAFLLSLCGVRHLRTEETDDLHTKGIAPLWDGREVVADYARKVNLSPTRSIDLGSGVTLELMLIPAGKFMMGTSEPTKPAATVGETQVFLFIGGTLVIALLMFQIRSIWIRRKLSFSLGWLVLLAMSAGMVVGGGARWRFALEESVRYAAEKKVYDEARNFEMPVHPVTIAQPFYMGKYTVTYAQYAALIGSTKTLKKNGQLPIDWVHWTNVREFCRKLTELLRDKNLEARVPTEAEWEFACRAGTTTAYYSGNRESDLDAVAWYCANSGKHAHPVGLKKPNAFGLYDMHGNIRQWCADVFMDRYPPWYRGSCSDAERMNTPFMRGGDSRDTVSQCRAAYRLSSPDFSSCVVGFRVVVAPVAPVVSP